jgi:hypothetical protein
MKQLNDNKMNIDCEWMRSERVLINPDGQVLPCCFLANVMYMSEQNGRPDNWTPKEEYGVEDQIGDIDRVAYITTTEKVLNEYYVNKDEYNIFKTPLEEIVASEWFTKTLPESWDDPEKTIRQCKKHCTKKNEE